MLKAVFTAIVLGYCVSRADLNAVAHDVAVASPTSLVLALASFLLVPVLGGLRWWLVLRAIGQRARIGTLACLFSVAMAVGQVLPSPAGVFAAAAALPGVLVWWLQRRPEPIGQPATFVAGA